MACTARLRASAESQTLHPVVYSPVMHSRVRAQKCSLHRPAGSSLASPLNPAPVDKVRRARARRRLSPFLDRGRPLPLLLRQLAIEIDVIVALFPTGTTEVESK